MQKKGRFKSRKNLERKTWKNSSFDSKSAPSIITSIHYSCFIFITYGLNSFYLLIPFIFLLKINDTSKTSWSVQYRLYLVHFWFHRPILTFKRPCACHMAHKPGSMPSNVKVRPWISSNIKHIKLLFWYLMIYFRKSPLDWTNEENKPCMPYGMHLVFPNY